MKINIYCAFSIVLFIGCNNSNHCKMSNELDYSYKMGFRYYKKLNLIERKGEEMLDNYKSNKSFPIFGIMKKNDKIIIQNISSINEISYQEYRIKDSILLSTKLTKDSDMQNLFYRDVTVVNKRNIITYEYTILDDFEYLQKIRIEDSNGLVVIYENEKESYYNYKSAFSENSIKKDFPSFKLFN